MNAVGARTRQAFFLGGGEFVAPFLFRERKVVAFWI